MKILTKKLRERGKFWAIYKEKRNKYKNPIIWAFINSGLQKIRTSKFDFALFNAWEYEQTDNLAAGMAQEVVRGLKGDPCHGFFQTIKGWFHKFWLAICFNVIENRWNLFKLLFFGAISWFSYLYLKPLSFDFNSEDVFQKLAVTGSLGLCSLATLTYLLKIANNIIVHPLPANLEKYFKLPNYAKHLGLIPVLKRHIKTLCMLKLNGIKIRIPFTKIVIGKDRKFLLFVDDLDRCKPDCIAETLDAIRLVMPIANVIVMICIDHRIAFKAVEKHYRTLAEKEDGSKRSSAAVARDYLGKIVQLPVRLEPIEHEKLKNYVYGKLFDFEEKKWKQFKEAPKPLDAPASTTTKDMKDSEGDNEAELDYDYEVEKQADRNRNRLREAFHKARQALGKQFIKPTGKNNNEGKIKDTHEEGKKFYQFAGLFKFNNPRQLLRLHNSFRFLKALGRGENINTLDILTMLFWQEFLHNWPMKVRGRCMAALVDDTQVEEVTQVVRGVLKKVKGDIGTLFNEEPTRYEELAKFVRVVVLPHNEEGVLDSAEAIKDWLDLEKKAEEEEALRRKESNL